MKQLAIAVILAIAMASFARAEESALLPVPQSNDACVRIPAGGPAAPVYPEDVFTAKIGATVRLEMEFADAQSAPRIKRLGKAESGEEELLFRSAEEFVRSYRNTCMEPGSGPVRVAQEFVFVPNDGRKVTWTRPSPFDSEAARGASTRGCVKHLQPGSRPEYPRSARRSGTSTRVVAQMKFTELDRPPEVKLLVPGARQEFADSVIAFAQGYRLTCGSPTLIAMQVFDFRIAGDPRHVLRDMPLKSFVSASTNAAAKPVYFDLDRMGCPFDVRMRYWQPHFRSQVGEVGDPQPERRSFLDWLAGLQLRLSPEMAAEIAGDEITVTVPCGKIDL